MAHDPGPKTEAVMWGRKKKKKKKPAPHPSADPESLLERQKAPGGHSENADTGSSNLGELIPPHGY